MDPRAATGKKIVNKIIGQGYKGLEDDESYDCPRPAGYINSRPNSHKQVKKIIHVSLN